MNRTCDAKAFARVRERTLEFEAAAQRWKVIYTRTCGSVTVSLALFAWAFEEKVSALCALGAGVVCMTMTLLVKPGYDREVKKRLNAKLPPLDLDS